jgi:hypothetical protein
MEHIMRTATRLPGGEQCLRLADALGVSVHTLLTGQAALRPADLLAQPVRLASQLAPPGSPPETTQVRIAVFACGCPGACPLAEPTPPLARAAGTVLLPASLLGGTSLHRLVAVQVPAALAQPDLPAGSLLVVDWDARRPRWAALALLQLAGRCRLGQVTAPGTPRLVQPLGAPPQGLARTDRVLGQVVARVVPCP